MDTPEKQLEEILELRDKMTKGMASEKDLKDVLELFLEVVNTLKEQIEQKIAQNKDQTDSVCREMYAECLTIKQDVKDKIRRLKENMVVDNKAVREHFEQKVNDLIEKIPSPTDLSAIEQRLAVLETPEPEEPENPYEARNELEAIEDENQKLKIEAIQNLEKRLKDLEAKPTGTGGGGTSALAVARAFKYIFHTEEPAGLINGSNVTYTVKNNIWAIVGFTLNGEQIAELPNYTFINHTITFASALPAAYSGKDFECKYIGS